MELQTNNKSDIRIVFQLPFNGKLMRYAMIAHHDRATGQDFNLAVQYIIKIAFLKTLSKYLKHRLEVYSRVHKPERVNQVIKLQNNLNWLKAKSAADIAHFFITHEYWVEIEPKSNNCWNDILAKLRNFIHSNYNI